MAVDYNYEFGFMTLSRYMTFASNTSILRDSNISIADTSATSDTTPCLYGLKIYDVAIGGVVHMPQLEFNVFCISRKIKEGWKIGGKNFYLV